MQEYKESIVQELRRESVLSANMFEQAAMTFEDGNVIHLEMEDSIVSAGRKEQIVLLLEEILNDRFHIKLVTQIRGLN